MDFVQTRIHVPMSEQSRKPSGLGGIDTENPDSEAYE